MIKAFKYRVYLNDEQKRLLAHHFGISRYIWNEALNHIQDNLNGKYPSRKNLEKRLVQIKKEEETV